MDLGHKEMNNLSRIVIVALAYFVLGKLGVLLALAPGVASLVFPAAGLAVAAVVCFGRVGAIGVFLGAMLLHLQVPLLNGEQIDWLRGLAIGLASVAQASVGAYLLRRWLPDFIAGEFAATSIAKLVGLTLLFCLISASLSVSYLVFDGSMTEGAAENWLYWWLGDSFGVLMIFPLMLLAFNSKITNRFSTLKVVLPVTGILLIAVGGAQYFFNKTAFYEFNETNRFQVDQFINQLDAMDKQYLDILQTISGVLNIKPNMTFDDFETLTARIHANHPILHALSLNFLVAQENRERFEKSMQSNPEINDFTIRERQNGKVQVASERDHYVAVSFITPISTNAKAVGFDIASNPARLITLQAAVKEQRAQVTAPITLVQEAESQKGYLIIQPTTFPHPYAASDNTFLPGANAFVVGVLRAGMMVNKLLPTEVLDHYAVHVFDNDELIYSSETSSFNTRDIVRDPHLLAVTQNMPLANRTWRVEFYTKPKVYYEQLPMSVTAISVLAMLVALLIQYVMLIVIDQANQTRNIVKKKTAELNDQKEKTEWLLNQAPEAYFVMNATDGKIVECNKAAEVMLRGRRADILGTTPQGLSPEYQPDGQLSSEKALVRIGEALANGSKHFEWMHQRLDGEEFWVEVYAHKARLNNKDVLYVSWREIGERKELEAQKEHAIEELNAKKVEQDKLFAIIGHELRTPAAALNMMLESGDCDANELLSASEHLISVLDDMRAVTQPSERIQGKVIESSLLAELQIAIAMQERLLSDHDINLHTDFSLEAEDLCAINAQLLRQIIINLMKNAVIHGCGKELWLAARPLPDAECGYVITIEDDGRGVAVEDQVGLFDPFVRGKSDADGTGLGLHVSREFAREYLGGDLVFEERVEGGARFILTVSFQKAAASTEQHDVDIDLSGKRVLLAEDNQLIRQLTEKLLLKEGVVVDAVEDGLQAYQRIQNTTYDCLITDLFMPKMNGFELTKKARELGYSGPIIAISAAIIGSETDKALAMGVDTVLPKPVNMDQLKRCLVNIANPTVAVEPEQHDSVEVEEEKVVIDFAAVRAMTMEDADFEKAIFDGFEDGVKKILDELTLSISASDYDNVKLHGHSLKGLARTIFAAPLVGACEAVEVAALNKNAELLSRNFELMKAKLDEVIELLNTRESEDAVAE